MKYIEKLLQGAEVEWKKLGEVCSIKTGKAVSKQAISENIGKYPVINSGREPLGFINIWNTENDPIGITTRGAGVGSVTWQEGRYFRGNLNYSISICDALMIETRFLYHLLLQMRMEIQALCTFQGIPALNAANLKRLPIPIPPLHVQQEIVRILDKFTELETELEAKLETELALRKQQYERYRDQLLSPDKGLSGAEVEWKKLGEVAELRRGRVISKGYLNENAGLYPVYSSQTENMGEIGRIRTFDFDQESITWTTDGAKAGTVFHRKGRFSITNVCGLIKIRDIQAIGYRYLYYWLSIEAKKHVYLGMGNPKLMSNQMERVPIPIPPLHVQQEIVRILDKFHTLTTSISEGLPREIELRKQQYAYYRDQLLSFER